MANNDDIQASFPSLARDTGNYATSSDPESRYYRHKTIAVSSPGGVATRTFETWERPKVPDPAQPGSRYFYVKTQDAYRPDMIAKRVYGNPSLWWWVMYSNKLVEVSQLRPGLTLQIADPPFDAFQFPTVFS